VCRLVRKQIRLDPRRKLVDIGKSLKLHTNFSS
jgi:hypothetical protein